MRKSILISATAMLTFLGTAGTAVADTTTDCVSCAVGATAVALGGVQMAVPAVVTSADGGAGLVGACYNCGAAVVSAVVDAAQAPSHESWDEAGAFFQATELEQIGIMQGALAPGFGW